MSTYSTNLKIELIGTGEQSNVWGSTTNTNFEAFEQSIVGQGTIAFPTDADYIVTILSTNTFQAARCFVLIVTSSGSLSATRALTLTPAIEKPYLVYNNTSGGQAIVIKNSAGTGITVPNGFRTFVYNNTVNFTQAFDYLPTLRVDSLSSSSASITGGSITGITDLAVADGGTGRSTFTAGTYLKGNGTSGLLTQSAPIPVTDGGTGLTTLPNNNLLVGAGTGSLNSIAPGTNGQVLTSNGVTWAAASVPAVTPTRFSAGATGFTPSTLSGPGDITLGGTLNVANGGTGRTTLTVNNVLLGNGTTAVNFVAPSTSGNVLTSNGSSWVSSVAPSAFNGQSFSGNGYQSFSSGLLIQWGLAATGVAIQSVTFPISFPSAVGSIQITPITGDGKRGGGVIPGSVTLSSFQLVTGEGGVGNQYFPTYWIAVGF